MFVVYIMYNLAISEIYEAAAAEFITGRQLMLPILGGKTSHRLLPNGLGLFKGCNSQYGKKRAFLMKKIIPMMPIIVIVFLFSGFCCQDMVQAQDNQIFIPDTPQVITNKHHLMLYAAELLEQMYVKPVTYEDPVLSWSGDTSQVPNSVGKMLAIPKRGKFTMPVEANPYKTPTLDIELLEKVVDAYQKQTDGPRFRVTSSQWGLHLIPNYVRNKSGQFVKSKNLLDTIISIPVGRRTPSLHFAAICDAVNANNDIGIRLEFIPQGLDANYSQVRISQFPNEEEQEQISFSWGINEVTARDALINMFDNSATTFTWHLLCDTLLEPICGLNIMPIKVNYMGSDGKPFTTGLSHDRKKATD
jgi:hypothetical protein